MLEPGTVLLDKYRVDRVLGRGGMAVVIAATHVHLGEPVAIKVLLPEMAANAGIVQRFLREAQAAARLKGEHVARVLDVGMLPSIGPYILMECLAGCDLDQLRQAGGRLSPFEAVDFILQACEALAEAHAAGIVHRDIKPGNFFITRRPDGSPLLKVLDFGISKVAIENQASNLTRGGILGTPGYMSPEQLRGSQDVDPRADVWSLGVVLFELLSGTMPFPGDSLSAVAIKAATEPTPMMTAKLPAGLDAIVYRCLEKAVADRYQSVAELAQALAPFAGDQRGAATVVERTKGILRWSALPLPAGGTTGILAPSQPTTLGSSAGAIVGRTTSRGRLGWIVGGGIAVGVIASVLVWWTGRTDGDDMSRVSAPAVPAASPSPSTNRTIVEPIPPPPAKTDEAPTPAPTPVPVDGAPQSPEPDPVAASSEPKRPTATSRTTDRPKARPKATATPQPARDTGSAAPAPTPPPDPTPRPADDPLGSRM